MRTYTLAAALIAAFLLSACAAPPHSMAVVVQDVEELPPEFERVLRDYESAWTSKDADKLASLFTEDGIVLPDGKQPVHGRSNIQTHYRGAGGPLYLKHIAWARENSIGYIIGEYAHLPNVPPAGKFTLTLKRDLANPDHWLIMSDMDSNNQRRDEGPSAHELADLVQHYITSLSGPGNDLACRDTLKHGVLPRALVKPADAELMRARREEVKPLLLAALEHDSYGAAFLLGFLHAKEAIPLLRKKLLEDRYFYGWEGPDYTTEEAYMTDDQYPHHTAYILALETIFQVPITRAFRLTDEERQMLEREAALANTKSEEAKTHYAAKWLLQRLSRPPYRSD